MKWLVGWSAVVLTVAYGLALIGRPDVDVLVPLYAAALVLMIESAHGSIDRRRRRNDVHPSGPREWGRMLTLGVTAALAALLILALSSVPVAYGLLVQVAGVGAAAAVLTTLILLVRQRT